MKGTIYGLYHDDALIYIGSTTFDLQFRLYLHLAASKIRKTPIYNYINGINSGDLTIREFETNEYNNKHELLSKEGTYIRRHLGGGRLLNKRIEYGFVKGDGQYNSRIVTCSCGFKLRSDSLYDHLRTKRHLLFLKNPDLLVEFLEKRKEKKVGPEYELVTCSCGGKYQRKSKARHLKTKLHSSRFLEKSSSKNKDFNFLC